MRQSIADGVPLAGALDGIELDVCDAGVGFRPGAKIPAGLYSALIMRSETTASRVCRRQNGS